MPTQIRENHAKRMLKNNELVLCNGKYQQLHNLDSEVVKPGTPYHKIVGTGCQLGVGTDNTPNRLEPQRLNCGITLVGKRARIPSGLRAGLNVRIDSYITERDFNGGLELASGESVLRTEGRAVTPRVAVVR